MLMKWHHEMHRKLLRGLSALLLVTAAGSAWSADTDGDGLPDDIDPDPLHSNFYTPDPVFGTGGLLMEKFGAYDSGANAVLVQPDSRIVTAGVYTNSRGLYSIALSRLLPDGQPDPAFNGGLPVLLKKSQVAMYVPQSIIRQQDGKLVIAGFKRTSAGTKAMLMRFNADGTVDSAFGKNGAVMGKLGVYSALAGVAQQPDGKLVAVGNALRKATDADLTMVAARYNSDGSFDTTFGTNGKTFLDNGRLHAYAMSMVLQRNGGIVAAGTTRKSAAANYKFLLARFSANGLLDSSFATQGVAVTSLGDNNDVAKEIIEQLDGKLVVGGYSESKPSSIGKYRDFALVRYNSDGSVDSGFGGGAVLQDLNGSRDEVTTLLQLPSGKIVAAGSTQAGSALSLGMTILNTDGSLDPSENGTGKVTMAYPGSDNTVVSAIAQQPDGKLVLAGWTQDPAASYRTNTLVARYYAGDSDGDGIPDPADIYPLDTDNDGVNNVDELVP